MKSKEYKCYWREGKICLAHLAEGRVFDCPIHKGIKYTCMDYKEEKLNDKPKY
jgi:hypothetical protein